MSKKLEIIKQYYSSMESLDPGTQADIKFLIQQAERVEQSENKISELTSNLQYELAGIAGYKLSTKELKKENQRYKQALEFYADGDNYEPWRDDEQDRTDAFNLVDLDGGITARRALEHDNNG